MIFCYEFGHYIGSQIGFPERQGLSTHAWSALMSDGSRSHRPGPRQGPVLNIISLITPHTGEGQSMRVT